MKTPIATEIPSVDGDMSVKMDIMSEIFEAIVNDITPADVVPIEENGGIESDAIDNLCNLPGGGFIAKKIKELGMEYEENSSLKAIIVNKFNNVEMMFTAL